MCASWERRQKIRELRKDQNRRLIVHFFDDEHFDGGIGGDGDEVDEGVESEDRAGAAQAKTRLRNDYELTTEQQTRQISLA